jgi:hypothetical protein
VSLLDNPQARRAIGAAAHQNFVQHHSPHPAAAPVVDLYEQMIAAAATIELSGRR